MSLKKFEIQEMVAKGGMAEVYRAKTTGFQGFEKEVCVKKILPHLTEDESFVTMFINEAKLAATLSYANIVSVHDLCVSAHGEYFIVMEYVHGKDLSDVIRAAQLTGREVPPEIAVYVCREVCKGLHYAHVKTDITGAPLNIIHRDVSPHNVLVSFMGEVKITDFGIAKASSIMNKTAVGILKGKYGYMSPEQARGQPLDHRSDIFNTGIVLYELLVGERCFAGSSDFSTLNLMRNAIVTPPSKINRNLAKDLESIVLKALSLDRNDRYRDALELEAALGRYADQSSKRVHANELATFMKELFSGSEESRSATSTGVLSLSSIVGPAPPSRGDSAQHVPHPQEKSKPMRDAERPGDIELRGGEAPADEVEPGREALERVRRRAERGKSRDRPEPPPSKETRDDAPPPPAALIQEKRRSEAAPSREKESSPSANARRTTTAEKRSKGERAEKPKETAAGPKEAVPASKESAEAEAGPPAEKTERKPARIKAGPEKEEKEKKKRKALSNSPKRPVGRRDLRPGLTAIRDLGRPKRRWALFRAAFLVILAVSAGAAIGTYRARQVSRQRTFREMELANRDPAVAKKPTVTLLISTLPAGATVLFDNIELSERTPLALERDRDAAEHTIEFLLDGYRSSKHTLKYQTGPVTRFDAKLSGEPGTLKVSSDPTELPVKVDGKTVGNTPLSMELPSGGHDVEIGDASFEVVRTHIDVAPGKTATLSKKIAPKGSLGSLRIISEPRAQILLDDQPTGRFTNDGALLLEPDVAHRIGLVVDEKRTRHEVVVRLKKGEKKDLFLDLAGS